MSALRLAAAILALALAGGCATDRHRMHEIDTLMQRYIGHVPGASLLVIHQGQPVVRRAYGMADMEAEIASSPATDYRLASVSKQFTAAAILLLAEDGSLGLDDRVRSWLPALPPAADTVTVRHLLTHTSGLVDYEDVIPEGTMRPLRDADVLRLLSTQNRTYFAPGTGYRYSNSGYALLALIVERATGRPFQQFLRTRIFLPLGMRNTLAYVQGGPPIVGRAYGYSELDGQWQRTDQNLTSAVLGDGGIYSSIDDLARWDAALYNDRLLGNVSRSLAFAPHTATDDPDVQYGFGWRISGEALWHSGETIGFRNVIIRYPKHHLTVVILSNRDDPEPYAIAKRIAGLFLGGGTAP